MRRWKKVVILFVLGAVESLLIGSLLLPVFVDRPADVRAFVSYRKSPTAENLADWQKERSTTENVEARVRRIEGGFALVNLLLLGWVLRKRVV
jgi:hypothetical protein